MAESTPGPPGGDPPADRSSEAGAPSSHVPSVDRPDGHVPDDGVSGVRIPSVDRPDGHVPEAGAPGGHVPARARAPRDPSTRGTLTVVPLVVERIATQAATEVHGVPWVPGRHKARFPTARAKLDADRATISIDIAVAWPEPVADVTSAVRETVALTIGRLTPFTADRVDVRVRSVAPDPEEGRVQ